MKKILELLTGVFPTGTMSKIMGFLLVLLTTPSILTQLAQAGETITSESDKVATQPIAVLVATLITTVGFLVGVFRRIWIK